MERSITTLKEELGHNAVIFKIDNVVFIDVCPNIGNGVFEKINRQNSVIGDVDNAITVNVGRTSKR